MTAFEHADGSTSVVQKFQNTQARIVFTVPDSAKVALEEDTLVQVGDSPWHIQFSPNQFFYENNMKDPFYLLIVLGILGVLLCVVIIMLLRYNKKDKVDEVLDEDMPIQLASAKKISKHQKTGEVPSVDDLEEETDDGVEELAEISDPLFQQNEILDVETISETDIDIESITKAAQSSTPGAVSGLFRDYDIRGNADEISDDFAKNLGLAIGSEAIANQANSIAVACDGRTSSPRIKQALIEGLLGSGINVVDIGCVPTPLMYYVTSTTEIKSGVMITASHNPPTDNGFKVVINGTTLNNTGIQKLAQRVSSKDFVSGTGQLTEEDYSNQYVDEITSDIVLAGNLSIVVDCGNAVPGELAPRLLEELGCDVTPLFCDLDGNFPNHEPDPTRTENLSELVRQVQSTGADLGIALDGDGDRVVAVTPSGNIVLPDVLLMLFAKDIVSRNPGVDVIFDIKCTRRLNNLISGYGGRPLMWKSGHSNIKQKMVETGALLGGELSGHIFFKERWHGFDDGLYSAARLLEILTIRDQNLDEAIASFPEISNTPEIRLEVSEENKFSIVEKLAAKGDFPGGKLNDLDGVRVDFAKGWGLVRASNTGPYLSLRFEADNDEMLEKIITLFKQQLTAVDSSLTLDF
jgi:phosphomannomutase/phosphoglucomutase